MKIYTKTGDDGSTSLYGGKRVSKSDLRVEAYGTIDELNAWIGLIRDEIHGHLIKDFLKDVQDRLFDIGSHLASDPEKNLKLPEINESQIETIEHEIDRMNEMLEPLKYFILPGGSRKISEIHITRTVCRRAERIIVALSQVNSVEIIIIKYLNRLSDYLFVLSRYIAKETGVEENKWIPKK